MAKAQKRQAYTLTLAAQKRNAQAFISKALAATASGNPTGRLPVGLPAPLPERLPAPALGPPLDIKQVAAVIGCSPWTVRQKLLPQGLPFFRSAASGKLIFYQAQVVRWIERQQEGG
jgi:hypothetical protein